MSEALFTDEPIPEADLFTDEPEPIEKSIGGFSKNAATDAFDLGKGMAKGAVSLMDPLNIMEAVKTQSLEPIKESPMKNLEMIKGIPGALLEEGKRIGGGELLEGDFSGAASKFGNALYDKPVTTALDVLPFAGAAGKGIGALRGAKGAGIASGSAEAAAGAAKQSIPTGATFQETVANLGKKMPADVKAPLQQAGDFVQSKYGQMAQKPGFGDMMGDAMIRKAQGMRFRELGGTPGQARTLVRELGEEGLRELTDVAKEKGITKSPIGYQRRQATKQLKESSGRGIGGIREMAAKRGASHDANSLVQKIKSKLDLEYMGEGTASSEKGAYLKALKDIEMSAKNPDVLARKITEMNKRAVKNKMTQPTGAITDVANEASRLNNELIKKHLSPKEIEFYDNSLRDFGASRIFDKLQSFEVGREMGGRSGVGGVLRNLKQGAMDIGGGKVMENFYDKFGPRLKSNPQITKNLANLGEGALDDLLAALDDAIDEISVSKK